VAFCFAIANNKKISKGKIRKKTLAVNEQGLLHVAAFENIMFGTKVKLKNKI